MAFWNKPVCLDKSLYAIMTIKYVFLIHSIRDQEDARAYKIVLILINDSCKEVDYNDLDIFQKIIGAFSKECCISKHLQAFILFSQLYIYIYIFLKTTYNKHGSRNRHRYLDCMSIFWFVIYGVE